MPKSHTLKRELGNANLQDIRIAVGELKGVVQNVCDYGATGDGVTDDSLAIQEALGGGEPIFFPPGTYLCKTALTASGPAHILGAGNGKSIIKANSALGSNPLLSVTPSSGFRIADVTLDGNSVATYSLELTIASETSVPGSVERVQAKGANTAQIHNNQVEDVSWIDCMTPGDESNTGSIPVAMVINIPNGANFIRGGTLFGEIQFTVQLLSVTGCTIGPFYCVNPNSADGLLRADGCYIYDGGKNNRSCVDTGTNLYPINITGSYLVLSEQAAFINGNNPNNGRVRLFGNVLIQGSANTNTTVYQLQCSGAGFFDHGGNDVVAKSGGTIGNFNAVSGATTVVTKVGGSD